MIGYGTMVYKNGDRYYGEWKNGVRHGHGEIMWENNFGCFGDFANDKMNGEFECYDDNC